MLTVHLARPLLALLLASGIAGRAAQSQSSLRDVLRPDRLSAARDSFVVLMQGQPRGWQRLVRTARPDGWEFEDAVSITSLVTQSSRIRMSPTLHERSLRQSGDMSGKPMAITLDFADGRVRGTANTPSSPSGPITIDTTAAAGVIDDNALLSLLVAVPWRDSLVVTAPYLTSGKGTIEQATMRAVSAETVSVPAGSFDVWRVELLMGRSKTLAFVTRQAPYRIVRIQLGPAFEMQLVR